MAAVATLHAEPFTTGFGTKYFFGIAKQLFSASRKDSCLAPQRIQRRRARSTPEAAADSGLQRVRYIHPGANIFHSRDLCDKGQRQRRTTATFRPDHLGYGADRQAALQDVIDCCDACAHDLANSPCHGRKRGRNSVCEGGFDLGDRNAVADGILFALYSPKCSLCTTSDCSGIGAILELNS